MPPMEARDRHPEGVGERVCTSLRRHHPRQIQPQELTILLTFFFFFFVINWKPKHPNKVLPREEGVGNSRR